MEGRREWVKREKEREGEEHYLYYKPMNMPFTPEVLVDFWLISGLHRSRYIFCVWVWVCVCVWVWG